jgi:hypothetical protein
MGAWNFNYDSLNRLVASQNTAASSATPQFAGNYGCWSYDRGPRRQVFVAGVEDSFGNRLSQAISTTPCGSNPPLMSWALYTIDSTPNTPDNGRNQIKGTANGIYQYDSAGAQSWKPPRTLPT